jgi:NAD(P)-dependent dehydrogenase (short-subunit alcohol dehydrogenase family)
MHIVITGTSRGIGLEFVRQYLERGDHLDAGVRQPDKAPALSALAAKAGGKVRIFACDTTSDASVKAFANAIGDTAVDMLINNAGVSGDYGGFADANLEEALRTFDTNALGPVRVTRALLPALRRSSVRRIVNISTVMASIADATSSSLFGYRMSKAALNMATKLTAQDLNGEGFTVLAVHPGWVQTEMGGPNATTGVEESVQGMIAQIDRHGPADTGAFFDFSGKTIPW